MFSLRISVSTEALDRMKARHHKAAFTLLELVFAMLVFAVLIGIGFAGVSHLWKGEKVETSARKMQSVMMRALRLSVADQKAFSVVVDPTRIRLIHASDVLLVENGDDVEEVVSIDEASILPGIEVFVRRWEEEEWRPLEMEILNFPVSGICEPVSFRLVNEGDVLEFALHPLTAFPTDETLFVN